MVHVAAFFLAFGIIAYTHVLCEGQVYVPADDPTETRRLKTNALEDTTSYGRVNVLCSDSCRMKEGNLPDICSDGGPRQANSPLPLPLCPLGTDCSACGPRTVVVFDTIQEAVGNFTNEDGVFDGSLYVESTSLTSLDGMQPVTRIAGSLALRYNAELEDITSLRSLESVDVLLLLQQNLLPGPLLGLESLRDVGVLLEFYNNTLLETIENLDSLTDTSGGVFISGHPILTGITMDNLRTVGSMNQTGNNNEGGVGVAHNPMLEYLRLPSLQYVDYQLDLRQNDKLSYVNIDKLEECSGFSLYNNDGQPYELVGPNTFQGIGSGPNGWVRGGGGRGGEGGVGLNCEYNCSCVLKGFFEIGANSNIVTISGFSRFQTISGENGFAIYENPILTSIDGFDSLSVIGSNTSTCNENCYMEIIDNPVLVSVTGFQNLTTIYGNLRLNNTGLSEFEAFESLVFVGGCCELDPAWLLDRLPACFAKLC